jgi:hypothetical protein
MVTFTEPGSTIPYMVQVRFSITGGSKIWRGGGVTVMVVFSRTSKTGRIGVVGTIVTFDSMPVVFSLVRKTVVNGVTVTLCPV